MNVYKKKVKKAFTVLDRLFLPDTEFYVSDRFRQRLSIDLVKIFLADSTYLGIITQDYWYKIKGLTEDIE